MIEFNFQKLPVGQIYTPEKRLRLVDEAKVQMLADSMQRGIQQQPILVHKDKDGRYRLVAGEHRFEAAKLLGWTHIECKVVYDQTDDQLEIFEIEENLIRGELTAIERDISLARRKVLYEAVYPETKNGGDRKSAARKSDGQNVHLISFSKDAARKMGLNRRTIDRSVLRLSKLIPDVIEALKTSPIGKNASEIEALSKMTHEEQAKVAVHIARGAKTLLNARKACGLAPTLPDPVDFHYAKLGAAWARAPRGAREKFLDAFLPGWRKSKVDVGEPFSDDETSDDAGDAA